MHDNLDLLHLLLVPVIGCVGYLMKKIDGKASRRELNESVERLSKVLEEMQQDRRQMHEESARRLDTIHQQLLDIVGGRYAR